MQRLGNVNALSRLCVCHTTLKIRVPHHTSKVSANPSCPSVTAFGSVKRSFSLTSRLLTVPQNVQAEKEEEGKKNKEVFKTSGVDMKNKDVFKTSGVDITKIFKDDEGNHIEDISEHLVIVKYLNDPIRRALKVALTAVSSFQR